MRRAGRGTGRAAGFTLLELLVVLAILGLGAAALVPALGSGAGGVSSSTAARDLVTALRAARAAALESGHPVRFELAAHRGAAAIEGPTSVTFLPDGGATAARFVVRPGGQTVAVDWLTGAVRRAD